MEKIIYIHDYVTLPCDDASIGIRRAFADAKEQNATEIRFEAGTYNLRTAVNYATDQGTHDAGSPHLTEKEVFLPVDGLHGIKIIGATDGNGDPATVLAGENNGAFHAILPSILWCVKCSDIIFENFAFTRNPEFASAGAVTAIDGDTVTLRVFDGNPCFDEMGTHCLNKFSPDGSTLIGESLSYGPGLGVHFHKIAENTLTLQDAKTAKRVAVGDVISFHQGAMTDFQVYFGEIENLTLLNLRTYNANGFAMLAFAIHNLTARKIVFKPRGNQVFTAPRDAWKLHRCGGIVDISEMYVEGVRMDGQNVHNNYFFVVGNPEPNVIDIDMENALPPFRTGEDGDLVFYDKTTETELGHVRLLSWQYIGYHAEGKRNFCRVRFTLAEPFPYTIGKETIGLALCFAATEYRMTNSHFRNVAGAGNLLRTGHVRIANCTYENMMNPGILLGAEYPTFHEGGNCFDVQISDCTFTNCGFFPRYGAAGCIGVKSSGFTTAVNRDISITHCTFRKSEIGVDIATAKDIRISDCTFEDIKTQIVLR